MKKQLPIYLYGSIIILAGIFLLVSENSSFQMIRITLGISLIVGAVFAFVTAFTRQRQAVQFAYHEMHALAMLVYGIALLLLCNSMEKLIAYTSFLFIFYTLSEIIFCNWLFNLAHKVVFEVVAIRTLLGLLIGAFTIVALDFKTYTIPIFGIMFILVGVNIFLYVPVMTVKINN